MKMVKTVTLRISYLKKYVIKNEFECIPVHLFVTFHELHTRWSSVHDTNIYLRLCAPGWVLDLQKPTRPTNLCDIYQAARA